MDAEDQAAPVTVARAAMFIGVTVAGAGLALWLVGCGGFNCFRPLGSWLRPARSAVTTLQSAHPGSCNSSELALLGAFNTCLSIDPSASATCPPGAGGALDVQRRLRDRDRQFLLYIQVDGGYKGPGVYRLAAWPHASLGVNDGAAKVAVREARTGALWRSAGGSLVVAPSERSGRVNVALDSADEGASPPVRGLLVEGPWRC